MPHFTLQIDQNGPILNALIGVSEGRRAALTAAGQQIPATVRIRALIDTGASCTCVDRSVLQSLNLTPTGVAPVNTPSTGSTPHLANEYDVSILIPGADPSHVPFFEPTVGVIEAELLAAQGIHALIGRDILGKCLLSYNGQAGFFTLAY